jgi:hypothetical protein
MRSWLVVMSIVCATGCQLGGGPVLGYRGGHATVGWEAGPGITDQRDGYVRADLGQSYRDGAPFTYVTLGAAQSVADSQGAATWLGGAIGAGAGDGGVSPVISGTADLRDARPLDCDKPVWIASLAVGLRWIAGGPELYAAPRFDVAAELCFDGHDE